MSLAPQVVFHSQKWAGCKLVAFIRECQLSNSNETSNKPAFFELEWRRLTKFGPYEATFILVVLAIQL